MANEWDEIQLSRIAKLRSGFPFKSSSWVDDGVPVIKIANIKDGRIVADGCGYVSHETATTAQEWMTQRGDVLIAMTGYVGEIARVRSGEKYLINQRVGRFDFLDDSPVIPEFFFYYLRQSEVRSLLETIARGSAQPNLSASDAAKLRVPVPPLPEQRAIAHILGTLDDKIELHRKQNETLEAMARALFKAWFVDFEPVRAKIEGRWQRGQSLPGLPAHLYDIFPDRLVDSELGEIPEGWGIGSFADVVEIIGGGTPKTSVSEYWGGDIPWFSVVDTPASSDVFVVQTEKSITQAGLNESSARLIFKGATIISARGTVGNLAIAGRDMTFNQSCYALRGKNGAGSYFVFLSAQRMVEQLRAMAHGSVFSTITRQTFEAVRTVLLPENVLQQFERSVANLFDQILNSVNESRNLAQLRDILLPKLISGELRVKDAKRILARI